MAQVATLERLCDESLNSNPLGRSSICESVISYIMAVSAGVFDYDSRVFTYDWDPI